MTITLACNRELQMNRMVENSIASEPLCGSRNNINQSKVALEWLSWQEHLLQKQAYMDIAKDHKAYDLMAVVIELAVLDHFLRKCARIRQLYNYYTIRWNHF